MVRGEVRPAGRRHFMFRALVNVPPVHLAEPRVFDFAALL